MPPSRMTTWWPPTCLRSTTRATYAPEGPTRNRPGSSSRRVPRVAGSPARRPHSAVEPAPQGPRRSSRSSWGSYGIPRPPPASTRRSWNPAAAASAVGPCRPSLSTWVARRPRVEQVRRPERVEPQRLELGRRDRLCARPPAGRDRPSRTCRPRRRRPAGPAPGAPPPVTAARSRTGCRSPEALGDPRQPPQLAGRLDRDRPQAGLDGRRQLVVALARAREHHPVRGEAGPRSTWRSSPPDATSAPRPSAGQVPQDGQVRVGLHRVGEVEGGRGARRGARPPGGRRRRGRRRRTACRKRAARSGGASPARRPVAQNLVAGGAGGPRRDGGTTARRGRTGSWTMLIAGRSPGRPGRRSGVAVLDQQRGPTPTARGPRRTRRRASRARHDHGTPGGTTSGASGVPVITRLRTRS